MCFQVFGVSYSTAVLDFILKAATKHATDVHLPSTAYSTTSPREVDAATEKAATVANVDRAALKAEAAAGENMSGTARVQAAILHCQQFVHYEPGNPCRIDAGPIY